MKRRLQTLVVFVLFFSGVYLLLPTAKIAPPLPDSYKSTEPGDTTEISGLSAYYTNMSRRDVVNYYRVYFSKSSFLGLPLPTYILNHPPEYTWEVIRDTTHSSFLEELVHPFRESLFVNGYEPVNDPFKKTGSKLGDYEFEGKKYSAKITVLEKGSNPVARLVIFAITISTLAWLLFLLRKTHDDIRHNR